MSLDAVKILEINVTNSDKIEILKEIQKYLGTGAKNGKKSAQKSIKSFFIVTPNPEQIVLAQNNSHFRDILNRADVALPDGIGVVWASMILSLFRMTDDGSRITKVIPGIDFMEELVKSARDWGIPVGLIGGRDGLALKTFKCLSVKYPGLRGETIDGPEVAIDKDGVQITDEETFLNRVIAGIIKHKIRIVFVGLGAPKQEYFLEKLASYFDTRHSTSAKKSNTDDGLRMTDYPLVLMSVGGSFDEITGRIPRAPLWVSGMGLKWLWRLILEPWRIKRQFALVQFVFFVLRERFSLN